MQGLQTPFSSHRGVGRYTENLIRELILNKGEHEIYLVLNGYFTNSARVIRQQFSNILENNKIQTWQQFYSFSGQEKNSESIMLCAEIIRESFILSLQPDIVFSTNLQEGFFEPAPTSVKKFALKNIHHLTTLHDVIPLLTPKKYLNNPITKNWYYGKISEALKSDVLITVSNNSRDEIIQHCNIENTKIFSIYNAIDNNLFCPETNATKCDKSFLEEKYNINKNFFLYSGGNDEHKNLKNLYQGLSLLPISIQNKYQLVLVGKELKIQENEIRVILKNLGINNMVIFTGYVDDFELISLYRSCFCFIFPSIHEGFGLPLLEAMSCGAVCLSSNVSSMIEINNATNGVFDPYNPQSIADSIKKAILDETAYSELKKYSIEQSKKFSWENSAKKLIKLINEKFKKINLPENESQDIVNGIVNEISRLNNFNKIPENILKSISQSIAESFPVKKSRKKRLYLDVSAMIITGDRSGIQRVVRAICYELLSHIQCDYDILPIFKSPDETEFHIATQLINEIKTNSEEYIDDQIEVDYIADDILLFLDLHPSLAISHREKTISLIARGVKVYHVIYDLLPIKYENYFWPELCSEFKEWFKTTLISSGVICISKSVSDQVQEYINNSNVDIAPDFINSWFHLGADINAALPTSGISTDESNLLNIVKNSITFIMVGTIEPRKKQDYILSTFDKLWHKGIDVNLIFIGKKGWGKDDFESKFENHKYKNKNVFWPKFVSDEFLDRLYTYSTCLIAASIDEGFGLPLIEAAQYNLPIIARNIPVFNEVAGSGAFYFPIDASEDELSLIIEKWINDYNNNLHPKSSDLVWLTWNQSAKQLLNQIINN